MQLNGRRVFMISGIKKGKESELMMLPERNKGVKSFPHANASRNPNTEIAVRLPGWDEPIDTNVTRLQSRFNWRKPETLSLIIKSDYLKIFIIKILSLSLIRADSVMLGLYLNEFLHV